VCGKSCEIVESETRAVSLWNMNGEDLQFVIPVCSQLQLQDLHDSFESGRIDAENYSCLDRS
jgi:hypothetical protein